MNLSQQIKDYFTLNRQEQRGVFVLLFLLASIISINLFLPLLIPFDTEDFTSFEKEISEFEARLKIQDSAEKAGKKSFFLPYSYKTYSSRQDTGRRFHSEAKEILIIELNSADTMSLQRLRGIGPAFAKRIVRYRERLGGFIASRQLLEVFGMDSSRYKSISGSLVVNKDSIRRINLNAVTFKALLSHPYFPYEITRPIMLYRDKHKKFKDVSELKNIPGINDSVFGRIREYVRVE